ncbi:MAG: GNAT family N-acetyltransferase [Bacteroidales bacterium]|nr:GNAT family N-acetyltransferase [Bacteroidales bacterium]
MIPYIVRFKNDQTGYFEIARTIRYAVFVEEQKVPEELEYDEYETVCYHYLAFVGDVAVGTCRWRPTSRGIKLERFAVLPEHRGKGFGDLLVQQALKDVLVEGKAIYLHAQEQVAGFYGRLGFKAYGERFEEAGIGHYLMKYEG